MQALWSVYCASSAARLVARNVLPQPPVEDAKVRTLSRLPAGDGADRGHRRLARVATTKVHGAHDSVTHDRVVGRQLHHVHRAGAHDVAHRRVGTAGEGEHDGELGQLVVDHLDAGDARAGHGAGTGDEDGEIAVGEHVGGVGHTRAGNDFDALVGHHAPDLVGQCCSAVEDEDASCLHLSPPRSSGCGPGW